MSSIAVAAPDPVSGRVEAEVPRTEHGRSLRRATAEQRAQPRHQDDVGEGLGQEVVGAAVQALCLVAGAALGRQHQDGRPDVGLPEPGAQLQPGRTRQHHVEDEGVIGVLGREPEPVGAVQSHVDREPLRLETALHGKGEVLVVVDHQDAHPLTVPRRP